MWQSLSHPLPPLAGEVFVFKIEMDGLGQLG